MSKPLLRLLLIAGLGLAVAGCKKSADTSGTSSVAAGHSVPAPPGGWIEQVAQTPDGGYRMGNPRAAVKVIEYGSRTCPHCAAFASEGLPPLKTRYIATGEVSYEFRDFAIHAPDVAAIRLGSCNGAQAFFPMLEQMFADLPQTQAKLEALPADFQQAMQGKSPTQQASIWADQLGYRAFVAQRGVPAAKAQACLADAAAIDALAQHMADGSKQYGITGTPTFIVNGTMAPDAHDWATLEPVITAALGG